MTPQIFIGMLFVVTTIVIVNADLAIQYPPSSTYSNVPWDFKKMKYPSTITFQPLVNSFYYSATPDPYIDDYQLHHNLKQNNLNGFEKNGDFESMNHVSYIITTSKSYPGCPWPGKTNMNSFKLSQRQKSTQASQHWYSLPSITNEQYQPLGYVSAVAKIDPPKGYKL